MWDSLYDTMYRYAKRVALRLRYHKTSYAQCAEDVIVAHLFERLGVTNPSYLDVGAHHPMHLSNTYLLYERGSTGVCIEPDPLLCKEIRRWRKRDTCLNIGIGDASREKADFYIFNHRALSTFSREEATAVEREGRYKISEVQEIPLVQINAIIEQYCAPFPNFVSLDAEGLDLQILRQFDFTRFRPDVLCVETIPYAEGGSESVAEEIHDLMTAHGYFVYANTYVNSIFVEKSTWRGKAGVSGHCEQNAPHLPRTLTACQE